MCPKALKILDLFCGAGGASMGMHRAYPNATIVGVDIKPQPHYPFIFVQGDALNPPFDLTQFDFIWASPPCQEYSCTRHLRNSTMIARGLEPNIRPKLIDPIRTMIRKTRKPYVIENVKGAPLPSAIMLCGSTFGLPIQRHRWFESNLLLWSSGQCQHVPGFYNVIGGKVKGMGTFDSGKTYRSGDGHIRKREKQYRKEVGQKAFDIDWMTVKEMAESIPPAYSEYILKQLKLDENE